jgi:hypothetical protein
MQQTVRVAKENLAMLLPHPHAATAARPVTLPMPAAAVTAGLVPGTRVQTDQGALPVEHLTPGDRIAVAGGWATLRRIERVRVLDLEMVVLDAGTLPGQTGALALPAAHPVRPAADWRVQVLHGEGAVLVPAGQLADGGRIRRERRAVQTLLRLIFDRPQVIRAEGAEIACATPREAGPRRPVRAH